jgi:16S rRNA processing protein RimM
MVSSPKEQYLVAGKITGAYGIKGWVKIHALLDEPGELKLFNLFCRRPGEKELRAIKLLSLKQHGKGLIAQLDGCNDRNAAELLAKCELLVNAEALPDLEEGDFYWSDLIGLSVHSCFEERNVFIGVVDSLFETGANDVLVVKSTQDSIDDRERLVPYLPDVVVLEIDLEAKRMVVDWDPEF